eukprot:GILK01003486.1.p1 GENE.GILK01003486.1~~GILK01003486.1.p1  ORF type:complete len:447 (+),score=77.85 GILK01003486.1:48-1343(+)
MAQGRWRVVLFVICATMTNVIGSSCATKYGRPSKHSPAVKMEQIGEDFAAHVTCKMCVGSVNRARLFLTEDKRVLFEYSAVGSAPCKEVSPGSVTMSDASKLVIAGRALLIKGTLPAISAMAFSAPPEVFAIISPASPAARSTLAKLLRCNIPRPLAAFETVEVCVNDYALTLPKIMVQLGNDILRAPLTEGLFRISLSAESTELVSHFDDPVTPSLASVSDPVQSASLLKFFLTTRPEISIPQAFWRPLCSIEQDDLQQLVAPLSKLSKTSKECLYYFLHIVSTVLKAHKDATETPGHSGHFKTVDSIATVVSAAVINSRSALQTVLSSSGYQSVSDFSSLMLTCPQKLTEMLIRLTEDAESVVEILADDTKICPMMKRKLRIASIIHDRKQLRTDHTDDPTAETVQRGPEIGRARRSLVVVTEAEQQDD